LQVSERRRLRPLAHVTNLAEFAACWSEPRRLSIVRWEGKTYVVWVGEHGATGLSGPSCYVFDGEGRLLDWTWQTGEGGSLDGFMSLACKSPEVTREDALRVVERNRQRRVPIPW